MAHSRHLINKKKMELLPYCYKDNLKNTVGIIISGLGLIMESQLIGSGLSNSPSSAGNDKVECCKSLDPFCKPGQGLAQLPVS